MRLGPKGLTIIISIFSAIFIFCIIALVTKFLPPKIILISLGGVSSFFLTLLRVEAGLIILIFMVPWTMQYEVARLSGAPFEMGTDDLLILCILFGWLGFLAIHKEAIFPHSPLNWPIGIFFAIALLSLAPLVATKSSHTFSVVALHLLKWFEYVIIYFVTVRVVRDWKKVEAFLYLSLISCAVVTIVQIYMMLTKQYKVVVYTPEGLLFSSIPGFESNGILGAYYVFFVGFVLALIANSTSYLRQGLLLGYASLLSFCLFFTFSRAAYIGLVATMIVIAVRSSKVRFRVPLIVFMVAIIALVFFLQPVMTRILMTVQPSATGAPTLEMSAMERLINWRNAFSIFVENPFSLVAGIGFWGSRFHGTFGFSTPHNYYLALLVETGILGLGVFCWLLKRIIHNTLKLRLQAQGNLFSESLSIGYLAGLVGLLTHAFFGETFESFRILGPFWFLTGLVMAAITIQRQEEMQRQVGDVGEPKEPVVEPALAGTHTKQFHKRFFQ